MPGMSFGHGHISSIEDRGLTGRVIRWLLPRREEPGFYRDQKPAAQQAASASPRERLRKFAKMGIFNHDRKRHRACQ